MFKNLLLALVSCASLSACYNDEPNLFCFHVEDDTPQAQYWAFQSERLVFTDKDSGDVYDFEFQGFTSKGDTQNVCTQIYIAPNSEYRVEVKGTFYYNTPYYRCEAPHSVDSVLFQSPDSSWEFHRGVSDLSFSLDSKNCVVQ